MSEQEIKLTREEWLNKAIAEVDKTFFKPETMSFKTALRVSVGWCNGKKAIGECWPHEASADDTTEMFISPALDNPIEVLATLLHEMVHAHLGNGKGHGKEFKTIVKKFGLEGRVTATYAEVGTPIYSQLNLISQTLGEYPHKKLTRASSKKGGEKKEGWVRFKSVKADKYRCMVSPVSLEEFGVPRDPWGEEMIPTKGVGSDGEE